MVAPLQLADSVQLWNSIRERGWRVAPLREHEGTTAGDRDGSPGSRTREMSVFVHRRRPSESEMVGDWTRLWVRAHVKARTP